MTSVARARHDALEGIQQLLALIEEIPSAQTRLLMQAASLDVASSVEELSSLTTRKLRFFARFCLVSRAPESFSAAC